MSYMFGRRKVINDRAATFIYMHCTIKSR